MIDLSIIIVSWNTCDLLVQCLESVAEDIRQLPPSVEAETWVVDNASSDNSVQVIRERFPWVRLIESQKNLGFAGANNQAILHSTGQYILLLNPDTVIKPGALAALVHFMQSNPQTGAAGSRLLNPDGSLQPSCYPAPTLFREFWRLFHMDTLYPLGRYPMNKWSLDKPQKVDVVQGAAFIVRREAINQVGLMDEEYFMYSEEMDLCYRLQQGGWSLYWVPQSQVLHYGGQSTKQVAAKMFLCLYESKLIFIRKHHGRLAAQGYKGVLLASAITRLLLTPLAWLEKAPQRQHHLLLASHYRRLLTILPGM